MPQIRHRVWEPVMGLFKQRKKQRVDRRQSLAGIPVLHQNVTLVEETDETVTIKLRVPRGNTILDRLRPPGMVRSYELDEFGSFVIRQLDGRKTVIDIIRIFEQRFRLSHREAELGVVAFFKMLMKRQVLSVVIE